MNDQGFEHTRESNFISSEVVFERHRTRQPNHHLHHPHQYHQPGQQQEVLTTRRQRSASAGRSRQSPFQIRASNFVKKLPRIFTSKLGVGTGAARFKQQSNTGDRDNDNNSDDATLNTVEDYPYPFRKARSLDMLRSTKPYMSSSPMLAAVTGTGFDSQDLSLARKSADGSHESGSGNADVGDDPGELTSKPKLKSTTTHSKKVSNSNSSSSIAQGLAVAALVAEAATLRPHSHHVPSPSPESSEKRRTPNEIAGLSNGTDNVPIKDNDMNTRIQNTAAGGPQSESLAPPPVPEKRPGHSRLSTLPPLTLHVKGMSQQDHEQRPQRFSPSVIVRPPPFPILELPALPTPIAETSSSSTSGGQSISRRGTGTVRLNSMPMLPREGSDARENDADHENCVLDEDEDGEVDDEENEDDGATGENDAAGSEDEDEAEAGTNRTGVDGRIASTSGSPPSPTASSFLSRTRGALSPRLQLPAINTPSLSSLLGNFTGTSGTSQSQSAESGTASPSSLSASAGNIDAHVGSTQVSGNADPMTTPKAVRANHNWGPLGNGSARIDYFSSSQASSGALSRDAGSSRTDRVEHGSDSQEIDKTFPNGSDARVPSSSSSSVTSSTSLQTPTARDHPVRLTTSSQSQIVTPMISVAPPPPPPWSPSETSTVFGSETGRDHHTKGAITGSDVPHLTPLKRPSIYHHASKSMIELFSTAASPIARTADMEEVYDTGAFGRNGGASGCDVKGKGRLLSEEVHSLKAKDETEPSETSNTLLHPHSRDRYATKAGQLKGLSATPTTAISPTGVTGSDAAAPSPTLRRQRSMPTFSTSGPPPPYPDFPLPEHLRRFAPLPREDEGKEELPQYTNDIRLAAIMPRKMEFSAAGVPARDRKWRRVHCVLEGTAFRVYDAPPRVTGVSALGGWWERKVGVGDVSSGGSATTGATAGPGATTNIVLGRREPRRRMKWEEELQAEEDARRAADCVTEEGQAQGRTSVSSSTSTIELGGNTERDRDRPLGSHKSKLHLAASLLHPNRSRVSLAHGTSSSPASPRSSFQSPRNSAEDTGAGSSPPSARPSLDLSSSQSSALSSNSHTANSTSASSNSLSGHSSISDASSLSTPTRRRRHFRSDSAQSSNNSHSRSNSRAQSPLNPDSQPQSHSHSQCQLRTLSRSHSNSYLYHDPNSSDVPNPDERDLLRVYSLQKAESGLASDYTKRKNVIRVRMEGEQFLLQCKDVASVVEWIEALQAATNIALDLDERPMPKGPIFPRRRRRRRVQPSGTGTQSQTTGTADSGTGASTNAGATESNTTS